MLTTRLGLLALILALCACASHVPPIIKTAPANNPELQQVVDHPKKHLAQQVRWGGGILNTENRANSTRLTILAMPLNDDGKPNTHHPGLGRFIADFAEFLEPSVYANSRMITVVGDIQGVEILNVGEYPYPHPVIKVVAHYLWPLPNPTVNHDWPPFWYDPWYYPYPYHRPYRPLRP
ncbi:MAG: Slp family lipoprotein [Gammaproteobacteria bacterium]|nr:Slp family lipoprotein [Gammaproteobacteria bacterium]